MNHRVIGFDVWDGAGEKRKTKDQRIKIKEQRSENKNGTERRRIRGWGEKIADQR